MEKIKRLRLCNLLLLPAGILTLLSSVEMEACGGMGLWGQPFSAWMYLHCALGLTMLILVTDHLYLHFGKSHWLMKIERQRGLSKWLCVVLALLLVLSIAALAHTVTTMSHSPIGAAHGKVGFLFLALCIWHAARHRGWIRKQLFPHDR